MAADDVARDRASLAFALSSDIEFIAIVKDSSRNFRLILLGGITGETIEEKTKMAYDQVGKKSRPWEYVHVLYRLEPVKKPKE